MSFKLNLIKRFYKVNPFNPEVLFTFSKTPQDFKLCNIDNNGNKEYITRYSENKYFSYREYVDGRKFTLIYFDQHELTNSSDYTFFNSYLDMFKNNYNEIYIVNPNLYLIHYLVLIIYII